jgi:putative aminopeptidase FrvX
MPRRLRPPLAWVLFTALVAVPGPFALAADAPALVADEELLDELKSAPKENPERVKKLRELYEQAGAPAEAITLQEVEPRVEGGEVLHNVIVTKKGKTDDVIVVGGHLDKVPPGGGVIDDWSGACLASNLYQSLRAVETEHTFVFIGFAHEEQGLLGSNAYVKSLPEDARKRVKAMVNLECLGPADPFLWTNGSTDKLEALAHKVADEHKLPLTDHVLQGVGADSIPFEKAGIPNITFDGLPREKFRLIHSVNDSFENVQPECYLNAYRLVLPFLMALDREAGKGE